MVKMDTKPCSVAVEERSQGKDSAYRVWAY